MHTTFKIATAAIILAGLSATSQTASANTTDRVERRMRVDYRESQIVDEAGARQLFARLNRAADKVCSLPGPNGRRGSDYRRCRAAALAAAIQKVDAPMLSALQPSDSAPVILAKR